MVITYYGLEFFKIQFGDLTVAINPVSKQSKHKASSFGADVVLVSLNDGDMNGVDTMARGDKEPFIISGPGEYEVSGMSVRGFATQTDYGGKRRINTVYMLTLENMRLCYLGALSHNNLGTKLKEALEDIDVLFVPIGGNDVLGPKEAHQMGVKLESRLVIPMHYDEKALRTFLKEEGEANGKALDKLTLKPKDVAGKEGDIAVLAVQ